MKVLQVHAFYQHRGGEESVLRAEADLLREAEVSVGTFGVDNRDLAARSRVRVALDTVWSRSAASALGDRLDRERPDVVHVHNTFPQLSPTVYLACSARGVPVVQTLHNYRMVCPEAMLLRSGHACTRCVGRAVPYPGIVHGCFRDSRAQTAVIAAMLSVHRARGTYRRDVTCYIALTEFARRIFVAGGIDPSRLVVKPNFLATDPGPGSGPGGYLLFAGRLSHEKGIETLIDAWDRAGDDSPPLWIAGDGPMVSAIRELAQRRRSVRYLGPQDPGATLALMRGARALVLPSIYYEGLPMTVVESFASATPVLCSDHGSLAEIVEHGVTGWRVPPGDHEALIQAAAALWAAPAECQSFGSGARAAYERRYTAESNLRQLLTIYADVIERAASRTSTDVPATRS